MTISQEQIQAIRDCLNNETAFHKVLGILNIPVEVPVVTEVPTQTVLIVDDEETVGSFMQVILQQQGYQTLVIQNGLECLNLLQRFKPDLILMDIGMPQMDGGELFEKVRRLPNGREVPVIFVTGLILQQEAEELNKTREDRKHYLGKPFTPRKLVETVQAMLANPD